MIGRILQTGWRQAAAQWRMAALLYAVNLFAALIPALAFRSSSSSLGSFSAVQEMLHDFRFSTLVDILHAYGKEVLGIAPVLPWLVLGFILINTFLAGGIVSSFCGMETEFSGKRFFAACAEYYSCFFRLLLAWGILAAGVLGFSLILGAAVWKGITDNAQIETAGLFAVVGTVILFTAIVLIAIADYSRIIIVANDEKRVLRALLSGAKFAAKNLVRVTLVLFLPLLIFSAALVIYFVKAEWFGMTSAGTVVLVFLLQQAFTMMRHWLHIFIYASETALYMDRVPMIM